VPKGYLIFTEDIHDETAMGDYAGKAAATLFGAGARVLAVADDPSTLEGTWHGTRTVLLEFDSVDAARAWYDSPDYAAIRPLRQAAADCNVALLPGFEMPGAPPAQ
jgi:uncharacterized protein (DUF1330 family)